MIDPFLIKGFPIPHFTFPTIKGFVAFQLLSETNATSFLLLQSILQSKSLWCCLYVGYWNFPFKRSFY